MSQASATPTAPPTANSASLAVFGVFAMSGVVFASWMSRLPAIRDDLGLTPGQMGLVLLVGSAGSLRAAPDGIGGRTGTAPGAPRGWPRC